MSTAKNSVTFSRNSERLEILLSREHTVSLISTISEMPRMPSRAWTVNVMKEEKSLSRRLVKRNQEEAEVLRTMMSVTSAKREVTGLTSVEIRDVQEKEDTLHQDQDLHPHLIPEKDTEEREEADVDHTLLQADLLILEIREDVEIEKEATQEKALILSAKDHQKVVPKDQDPIDPAQKLPKDQDPNCQEVQNLMHQESLDLDQRFQENPDQDLRPQELQEEEDLEPHLPEDQRLEARCLKKAEDPVVQEPSQSLRVGKGSTEAEADQQKREIDPRPKLPRSLIK